MKVAFSFLLISHILLLTCSYLRLRSSQQSPIMPPKRQNENENQASEATQKKQRNSNKQWATDTNSDGVSAEEHVAVWLSTIPENGRLPNFHNWKTGHEKKDFWSRKCLQYLTDNGCDSRRQFQSVALKVNMSFSFLVCS